MPSKLYRTPNMRPRPEDVVKTQTTVEEMDPVIAYKAGYLDGIRSVSEAAHRFASACKANGLDDLTTLRALLIAIDKYSIGGGVEQAKEKLDELLKGKQNG